MPTGHRAPVRRDRRAWTVQARPPAPAGMQRTATGAPAVVGIRGARVCVSWWRCPLLARGGCGLRGAGRQACGASARANARPGRRPGTVRRFQGSTRGGRREAGAGRAGSPTRRAGRVTASPGSPPARGCRPAPGAARWTSRSRADGLGLRVSPIGVGRRRFQHQISAIRTKPNVLISRLRLYDLSSARMSLIVLLFLI
jgi:hypothetical protein